MNVELSVDHNIPEMTLSGNLTIANAEELKNKMMAGLEFENISIRLKDVESIDLAGVQVLLAYARSAKEKKQKTGFLTELPDEIRDILNSAGISQKLKSAFIE
jgi:anti-anti-sigma factor